MHQFSNDKNKEYDLEERTAKFRIPNSKLSIGFSLNIEWARAELSTVAPLTGILAFAILMIINPPRPKASAFRRGFISIKISI